VKRLPYSTNLILRSRAISGLARIRRGVSKDDIKTRASWFETRRFTALLTMRGEA
jgi:hypothetical protein